MEKGEPVNFHEYFKDRNFFFPRGRVHPDGSILVIRMCKTCTDVNFQGALTTRGIGGGGSGSLSFLLLPNQTKENRRGKKILPEEKKKSPARRFFFFNDAIRILWGEEEAL